MLRNSQRDRSFAATWVLVVVAACWPAGDALAYVPDDGWTTTASGTTGDEGFPITLTWSLAPDGTSVPSAGSSNMVSYLDGLFSSGSGGSDLSQRPWFSLFEACFDRWNELGGINFVYEEADDGAQLYYNSGVLGVRGDIRLGGTYVDGASGTLAYTWLPDVGDMVIDTGETTFYSDSTDDYRAFRNVVTHELGHSFGLLHVESSTAGLLMEPYIDTSFDGPQLDDIRAIQGMYGDALEKTNNMQGNGSYQLATDLGTIGSSGGSLAVGSDATGGQEVDRSETDFVSIANSADADFFSFTLAAAATVDLTITPLGGEFYQGVEGGTQSLFDANSRNNLALTLFDTNGTTLLASADNTAAGGVESLTGISLADPGEYFVRVSGANDAVQLYELAIAAAVAGLPGDYNNDGVVDAADYTVWRDSLGESGSGLAADGDGNGAVDNADYTLWLDNYGTASASGGLAEITSVPEPGSALLLLLAAAKPIAARRRK